MNETTTRQKSIDFAIRIVNLYKHLVKTKKEYTLAKQILRSGTSIGANIAEAACSISRKEFLAKTYIAFKECSETRYWLELLYKTEYITQQEYTSINADCTTLYQMLSATTKTLKSITVEGKKEKRERM